MIQVHINMGLQILSFQVKFSYTLEFNGQSAW
jgi:hypothetical protein